MMMKISVILMMIVAVIFAASQSECNLLNQICEQAEDLLFKISEKELNKTRLAVASESTYKKCWKGFFCRAEKSLNATHLPKLDRLKYLIEQYNKNHSVTCDLNSNITDTLKIFLTEVEECTRFFKKSKGCVHRKQGPSHGPRRPGRGFNPPREGLRQERHLA